MKNSSADTVLWICVSERAYDRGERRFLKKLLKRVLDVLYPPRCPVCGGILADSRWMVCPECKGVFHPVTEHYCMKCGRPVKEQEEYCKDCQGKVREFRRGRSVFLYNAQMKKSLMRYKYHGSREYGRYYAWQIYRYMGREIRNWNPDLIVPVPLHRRKRKLRGFNQSAELAVQAGKLLGIPVAEDVVIKKKETKAQKKLSADERKRNLKDAFEVQCALNGLKVLIVDDVYTTGSTVEALAAAMKEKGAAEVYFITLCTGQI